jgi:hypothetical protein
MSCVGWGVVLDEGGEDGVGGGGGLPKGMVGHGGTGCLEIRWQQVCGRGRCRREEGKRKRKMRFAVIIFVHAMYIYTGF